jgi:mono/diheme cytochrome c family protein
MHTLLKQYDAKSPWQYYNLVNVQWPTLPVPLSSLKAPVTQPLPDGTPNDPTLVNAVLETFLQQANVGCIGCHQYAATAASGGSKPTDYAGYSFMFGRASAPQ